MRGHIHKRVHTTKSGRKSTLYYAIIETRGHDGGRRQDWGKGYRRRKDAEAALPERLQVLGGRSPRPKDVDLATYFDEIWLPRKSSSLKPSTASAYRTIFDLYVRDRIGWRRLSELTKSDLLAHSASLLREGGRGQRTGPPGSRDSRSPRPLAPSTVRKVEAVLSAALVDAFEWGYLRFGPQKLSRTRAAVALTDKAWMAEEVRTFEQHHCKHELFPVFQFIAHTGVRRCEALALSWADVNFEQACVSIRRSLVMVDGRPLTTSTKSHVPRVVNLDAETLEMLRRHRQLQLSARAADPTMPDTNLVFTDALGRELNPDRVSASFARAVAATPGVRRLTLHGLRHTHATLLLQHGTPVKVVAERLGHADPAFTIRVYQSVLPGMQADAAALFATITAPTK